MRQYQHEVKYYECDRMGITHHSNYVRFMEEARVDWMDQVGYGFDRMEAEGVVSPVVSVECVYRRPTTFKDVVLGACKFYVPKGFRNMYMQDKQWQKIPQLLEK